MATRPTTEEKLTLLHGHKDPLATAAGGGAAAAAAVATTAGIAKGDIQAKRFRILLLLQLLLTRVRARVIEYPAVLVRVLLPRTRTDR